MKTLKVGDAWDDDPLKYDLSEVLIHARWKEKLDAQPKNKTVTLRMQHSLFDSINEMAKFRRVPYQSLMRDLVMEGISRRKNDELRENGKTAKQKKKLRKRKA